MTSATVRRNVPLHRLAALCVVAALASTAFAQEGEKKEEKPDLAKRALDVLFDSGAEKDADAEKTAEKPAEKPEKSEETEKTEETQPAESDTEAKPATDGSGEAAAPAKPATDGAATPGAPWPNKPATGGAATGEGAVKPKPFVPPGTGTAGGETPTRPAPVKPIPSDPAKPAPGTTVLAPKPAPVAPTAKTYKIQPGDTFSSIAIALYGDEKKWAAIAQANPLVDPTKLKVGQEIRLPDLAKAAEDREKVLAEAAAAVAKPAASGADGVATTVTVQPGDTLSHIAHRVYGKAKYWTIIFEANKDQLKDAGDVKVGQKLKIPPKPSE